MLVAAAAAQWKLAPDELKTENGFVANAKGDKLSYGALAAAAAKLTPPAKVTLKDPKDWKLIGKPQKRLDGPAKVMGRAEFGIDIKLPGLLVAAVKRSPVFGGKLKTFKAEAALKVPGVVKVVQVPTGVAVVAKNFWAAQKGRDAVTADWDLGDGASVDTDKMMEDYRARSQTVGAVAVKAGDVDAALAGAAQRLDAVYEFPFLAHAPMEPLNATVSIGKDHCEIWTGSQFQTMDQGTAAKILGMRPEQVSLHTPFLGGGFGRRANFASDCVGEAVEVAKSAAAGVPVKTLWTREDDIRGGYYRPLFLHRLSGGLDAAGKPVAWKQTAVGQPIMPTKPGSVDEMAVEGAANSPYILGIPAHLVTNHATTSPVPVLWWRSVGGTHTAFAVECFIDELAHAAKRDPVDFRHDLLKGAPRHLRVLAAAAERAGWGKPSPSGTALGVAVHESFGSTVCEIAEVSIEGKSIRVHRVTAAIDCGLAVNPDGVAVQLQSAVNYGLTAALYGAITIKNGEVQESNFDDYKIVRMNEAPRVDTIIVPSTDDMGGVGEPGTPPIAPAVGNAIFALTGKRLRTLPFSLT